MAQGGNGIGAVVSALARHHGRGTGGGGGTAGDTGATVDTSTNDTSAR